MKYKLNVKWLKNGKNREEIAKKKQEKQEYAEKNRNLTPWYLLPLLDIKSESAKIIFEPKMKQRGL